jgi:hypothetical protein
MTSQSFRLILAGAFCVAFLSCLKDQSGYHPSQTQTAIEEAENAFSKTILSQPPAIIPTNYRASAPKTVEWENARVTQLSVGQAIVVPLHFRDPLYLSSSASPAKTFSLNDLAKLVIYRDKVGQYVFRVLTFIPDSNYSTASAQFSGTVFNENWQGASVTRPWQLGDQKQLTTVDAVGEDLATVITVCTTINGYNYAADDPEDGYAWTETSCDSYILEGSDVGGGGLGAGDAGGVHGSGGGGGAGSTITIAPPTNKISNIKAYLDCFVNGSLPTASFTVTVCVDQPDPGTRTPWTFSEGGIPGSSAAGNLVNVGHTFLVLTENNQGNITTRNVGFYPNGYVSPIPAADAQTQGVLNDDETHPYNVSLTIQLTGTQFMGILNQVSLGNNAGYDYNINSYNCTTFVIDALRNNGITLPATVGTWAGGSGNDPGDLGQDIMGMTLQPGMTRNTSNSPHPNTGTCN